MALLLFFIGLVSCISLGASGAKHPAYILNIQSPKGLRALSDIPCIYHGLVTFFSGGHCRIPEDRAKIFFNFVITDSLQFERTGHHIYARRVKGNPCKWYNITLKLKDKEEKNRDNILYYWEIEEINYKKMPELIPDHSSIIVKFPAQFIEKLETPSKTGPFTIRLPSIILCQNITKKQLNDAILESALDLPALNITCTKATYSEKKHENVLISQPEFR
jgi:hypothetical protein